MKGIGGAEPDVATPNVLKEDVERAELELAAKTVKGTDVCAATIDNTNSGV
jgi:hypothetical protein